MVVLTPPSNPTFCLPEIGTEQQWDPRSTFIYQKISPHSNNSDSFPGSFHNPPNDPLPQSLLILILEFGLRKKKKAVILYKCSGWLRSVCHFERQLHLGGILVLIICSILFQSLEKKIILDTVHRLAKGVLLVMQTALPLHPPLCCSLQITIPMKQGLQMDTWLCRLWLILTSSIKWKAMHSFTHQRWMPFQVTNQIDIRVNSGALQAPRFLQLQSDNCNEERMRDNLK